MLKLFRYLWPWRRSLALLMALVFFQVLADLFLPTLMSDIIDKGVLQGDSQYILNIGGIMLLITLFSILCAVGASYISSTAAAGFGQVLRSKVFHHVSGYSLHEFDQFGASTLITRTTNDITQVQMATIMIARMMLMAPMMAVGGLTMAFIKDPELTWIFAVSVPALVLLVVLIARKAIPLFTAIQGKVDILNNTMREALTGVRVIRAFNQVNHERERFDESSQDLSTTYIKVNRLMAFMMPGLMLVMNITIVAILWFGFHRIDGGTLQVGSLIAFTQYAMQIMFAFMMMSMMFNMLPRAQAAAVRIQELLDVKPALHDPEQAQTPTQAPTLEFDKVSFRYHGAEAAAIDNLSFRAEPGKVTAIIGSTGSGKTTLTKLLPRFYDIETGSIRLGGVELKDYKLADLRQRIAYVPQQVILFAGTIESNLLMADPAAPTEQRQQALTTAQADEFVQKLEGKEQHELQQGARNLSGGQRQRLSIARALARKAELYIFDDCFSALDFKTDARLRAELKQHITAATVILVAQRVATVMDADQILVLNEGKLVGKGSHQELLKTCPTYQEIVASQLSEEEAA